MKVIPVGYNLLVQLHPGAKTTPGGIQLPEGHGRKRNRGRVVALGDSFGNSAKWEGVDILFDVMKAEPVGEDDLYIVPDSAILATLVIE